MRIINLITLVLIGVSCNNPQLESIKMNPVRMQEVKNVPVSLDSVTEFYSDSVHIGIPGSHRLELRRVACSDSIYADFRFFEKQGGQWVKKQHFSLPKDGITGCDPEFKDFNNDGFNDITYKSAVGARGANEIRTLFIFEPKSGIFTLIRNSENYPNLQYNKKLDCIDAFAVYGGSTSYFLKIEQDSLRPFARVDLFNGYREIYTIDKTGKDKLTHRDPFEPSYLRYKNFDPLEEYENF